MTYPCPERPFSGGCRAPGTSQRAAAELGAVTGTLAAFREDWGAKRGANRVIVHLMKIERAVALLCAALLATFSLTAQSRARKDDPDVKEIRDYRLNMDVIQRYIRAFKIVGADEAAKKCLDHNPPGDAPTLDAGEKLLNACPAAVGDLKTAAVKPREFLIVTAALIGDFMAVGMKKAGTIKEYPDSISPENAAFIEQNYDKLQTMLAPFMGK